MNVLLVFENQGNILYFQNPHACRRVLVLRLDPGLGVFLFPAIDQDPDRALQQRRPGMDFRAQIHEGNCAHELGFHSADARRTDIANFEVVLRRVALPVLGMIKQNFDLVGARPQPYFLLGKLGSVKQPSSKLPKWASTAPSSKRN